MLSCKSKKNSFLNDQSFLLVCSYLWITGQTHKHVLFRSVCWNEDLSKAKQTDPNSVKHEVVDLQSCFPTAQFANWILQAL